MQLTLISREGPAIELELSGQVTFADGPEDSEPISSLLEDDSVFGRRVALDMSKTSFIDSCGIGWLLKCHRRFDEDGGRLVIHSVPPMVDKVFRMLKMERVLHLAENRAAANEILNQEAQHGQG